MFKRLIFLIVNVLLLFSSCEKGDPGPVIPKENQILPAGNGLFVMNEGNYGRGNGSVSFWHSGSDAHVNALFLNSNNRQPGDIPFYLLVKNGKGYLTVNNSGKLEIVDIDSFKSIKTITGLVSPRYIVSAGNDRGYISSLYSDSVAVFCFKDDIITGYINIGSSSEQIIVAGDNAFIASWSFNNMIIVVDIASGEVIDEIVVEFEPESMVVDRDGMLWVLCSGGFLNQGVPALVVINSEERSEVRRFLFPQGDYPTNLRIDKEGGLLFYLNNGVYKMPVTGEELPEYPLIDQEARLFYRMEIFSENGDIFVTDARDYQRRGSLLRFSNAGVLKREFETGIIPGIMIERIK